MVTNTTQKFFIVAVMILLASQGRRIVYTLLGYYYVTGFDGAHILARKIIDKELNAEKCLNIKYSPLRILPDYLTSSDFQDECLESVAIARMDPIVCSKMSSHYSASLCGSHIYGGVFNELENEYDLDDHNCSLDEESEKLECYYRDGRDKTLTQIFSVNECYKFSKSQYKERCNWYHINTVNDCDKFKYGYLRERCYFFYDATCRKSYYPILQKGCEANKIINENFKDDEYRRSGYFW